MPSLEAAYPWLLALAGTSLFAGFGLARRLDAGTAARPRRLRVGIARGGRCSRPSPERPSPVRRIANELALRDRATPPAASRFGPTDAEAEAAGLRRSARRRDERAARSPICAARSTAGRSAPWTCPACASGPNFRWLAYVATDRELGQYGAASFGGRAWTRTPVDGWAKADAESVRRADARPPGGADRRSRDGSRSTAEDRGIEVIEGAPRPPLPGRRRRDTFRGGLPAGPLACRRRRPPRLARPARLLGLRSTASSARSRARSTARPAGIEPEAHPGDHRGVPDRDRTRPRPGHLSSGAMTFEDEPERFGKRDRLARMLRVVTVLRGHPDGHPPSRDRAPGRGRDPDRLPRPAGARGGGRRRGLVRGRPVGRRRRGVPAAAQADPRRGHGGRPVGAADGPLRRQVRPGPRGGLREARGGPAAAARRARRADPRRARPATRATRRSASTSTG